MEPTYTLRHDVQEPAHTLRHEVQTPTHTFRHEVQEPTLTVRHEVQEPTHTLKLEIWGAYPERLSPIRCCISSLRPLGGITPLIQVE